MKRGLIGFILGVILASAAFLSFDIDPRSMRNTYVLAAEAKISFPRHGRIGFLPQGTPLLAPRKVAVSSDVGWWGCIPVLLGTDSEAYPYVEVAEPWTPDFPAIRASFEPQEPGVLPFGPR